jgi:hypothetical protein
MITTVLFMKGTLKLPFPTWREQERTGEHSGGINDKLQKMTNMPFTNKQFICSKVSLYVCLGSFKTRL